MTAVGLITTRSISASEKWRCFEADSQSWRHSSSDILRLPAASLGRALVRASLTLAYFSLSLRSRFSGRAICGELRLKVTDPDGLGVKTTVQIVSAANQYRNNSGDRRAGQSIRPAPALRHLSARNQAAWVCRHAESVDIHSSIPTEYTIHLKLPTVNQSVTVSAHQHIDRSRSSWLRQSDWLRYHPKPARVPFPAVPCRIW